MTVHIFNFYTLNVPCFTDT